LSGRADRNIIAALACCDFGPTAAEASRSTSIYNIQAAFSGINLADG